MNDKWVLVPAEPTPEMLEPMAREDCKHDGFDPDEPMPPHGHYPRWYDRCGPFAEIYRAMLAARPAAPAQDEIGWLIEFPHKASGPTYYGLADDGDGTVNLNSNADHSHAVRFARREDALMVAADIGWTSGEFLITEHMWVHKP